MSYNDSLTQLLELKAQLSKLNVDILSLKQTWWQKNYGSLIAILSIVSSYIVALKVSKWSYTNQLKLEKIKREADKKDANAKLFAETYSKIELILSSIKELNIERINTDMYGAIIDRGDFLDDERRRCEKLLYDSRQNFDVANSKLIQYKSDLSYVIGKIQFDNSDYNFINEAIFLNTLEILFDFDETKFRTLQKNLVNATRINFIHQSNDFVNQVISPKYQTFILTIQKKLNS